MMIGIVGKPNSGKSSMLKALTMADVKISPVPFTTIKPNMAAGHVIIDCVCKELGKKCSPKHGKCENGKRFVPVKLIDVAGLVPGAHEGRGLGNQFLDDLRTASALIHTIDCSGQTDAEGKPTVGRDPEEDITFLEKEIDLWFAGVINKAMEKNAKQIATASQADLVKVLSEQLSGLEISKKHVDEALSKSSISNVEGFATELRRLSKPTIIAANKVDLGQARENYEKLKAKHTNIVPVSAEAEITLKKAAEAGLVDYLPGNSFQVTGQVNESQAKALDFLKKEIIDRYGSTGVQDCLNKAVFQVLDYIAVYPVADANKLTDTEGHVLPDVFLVPKGTTALELAFKIHTDIGNKFVCAIDARTKKKLGKEYVLKDKDAIEIMTSK